MVFRRRHHPGPSEARAFVELLGRHRAELLPHRPLMPARTPRGDAFGTLLDQQAEILAIVTGEPAPRDRMPSRNAPPPSHDLVELLSRQRSEMHPHVTWLPIRSPARAAVGMLFDQQAAIVTILTGDPDYFKGKNTTPRS